MRLITPWGKEPHAANHPQIVGLCASHKIQYGGQTKGPIKISLTHSSNKGTSYIWLKFGVPSFKNMLLRAKLADFEK